MRIVFISALALAALSVLSGCFTLRANIPEEVVRQHIAREDGLELAAICSYEGHNFSEGARLCMSDQRMSCDPSARWVPEGKC